MLGGSMDMESATSNTLFNPKLSLYIPIVDESVNEAFIREVFLREQLAQVSRVDFVHNMRGKKQAFVHFASWTDVPAARELQAQILDSNQEARIIYGPSLHPKFWPLLPNRNPLDIPRSEIISVLQDKIVALERKLNEVNLMENDGGYNAMPTKRLRSENSHENLVISPAAESSGSPNFPAIVRQNNLNSTPPP